MISVFVFLGWESWMWAGSLGCLVAIYLVLPFMPRQADPNHRVPMIGSRYSPMTNEAPAGRDAQPETAG